MLPNAFFFAYDIGFILAFALIHVDLNFNRLCHPVIFIFVKNIHL